MTIVLSILKAIIAIPQIASIIQRLFGFIIGRMDEAKHKKIEEAAIATRKAKTKEERREAAKLWHDAINS